MIIKTINEIIRYAVVPIVRVIRKTDKKIIENNGVAYGPIKQEWADWTNLTPDSPCTAAIVETKHGLALMFWADEQPQLEDNFGEDL